MRSAEPFRQVRAGQGFTLLEIMLAMFVFALLIGSIFSIVSGTTQLADEMQRGHDRDAQVHGFAQFCERTFRKLPARAQIRLRVKQSGNQYLSQVAILNAPPVFGPVAGTGGALTIIETDQQPDGYLRIVLRLVRAEELTDYEAGQENVGQILALLENVTSCEWRFFNQTRNDWEAGWNASRLFSSPINALASNGQFQVGNDRHLLEPPRSTEAELGNPSRPGFIELALSVQNESPRRFVFWVPPAEVPGNAPGPRQHSSPQR